MSLDLHEVAVLTHASLTMGRTKSDLARAAVEELGERRFTEGVAVRVADCLIRSGLLINDHSTTVHYRLSSNGEAELRTALHRLDRTLMRVRAKLSD